MPDHEVLNVDVGSTTLACLVTGDAEAPPMVLLHAMTADSSTWAETAGAFGRSHRVYVPDARGHGDSEWPGTYSLALMRDDVLGLFDAFGLEHATLIGHSLGGIVALLFAEEYETRLDRLVIEDSALPSADDQPPRRNRREGPLGFDEKLIHGVRGDLESPDPTWWQKAGTIQVPTLFIAGGADSHVSQERIAENAALLQGGRLTTIPVGHHIHRDNPQEFIATVDRFLADTSAR
jgi:3-oxoadipate enol-lactonase